MVEVDQHQIGVIAGQHGPLILVVDVTGQHRVAGRHGARETGLRQRAVGVGPVPNVDVRAYRRTAQSA